MGSTPAIYDMEIRRLNRRRWFWILSWVFCVGLGTMPLQASEIRLDTGSGTLLGTVDPENGVAAFKGIPYALPPVGEYRWRAAAPVPPRSGVHDARAFGPQCVQRPTRPGRLYHFVGGVESEDCLYLNVWTPSVSGQAPVMVWIHGGALVSGSASLPAYDGAALAAKGVVVVTLNYRLGVFGFFAHPELVRESPHQASGNQGLSDQIQALRWVQANISRYGGDPGNVTIFGESAGGWSVTLLMTSPVADGLFHRAIAQSGAYVFPMRHLHTTRGTVASAIAQGRAFAADAGAESLAALRALPAHRLMETAVASGYLAAGAQPIVDGWLIERPVADTLAAGEQHDVPVILGFNADEGMGLADAGLIPVLPVTPEAYRAEVVARYQHLADAYLDIYPSDDIVGSAFAAFRDGMFGWHLESWARAAARLGSHSYMYFFDYVSEGGEALRDMPAVGITRRLGAFHGAEIPFVFNHPTGTDANIASALGDWRGGAADAALADAMSDYWVAFARLGVPAVRGRPTWLPFEGDDAAYMNFGAQPESRAPLLPGHWAVHESINRLRAERGIVWGPGDIGLRGTVVPAPTTTAAPVTSTTH